MVENEKKARRFIKFIDPKKKQNRLNIKVISKIRDLNFNDLLEPCELGNHIGLLSDSGCPGIADPGSDVIYSAHMKNIIVHMKSMYFTTSLSPCGAHLGKAQILQHV